MRVKRRSVLAPISVFLLIIALSQCITQTEKEGSVIKHANGKAYAGSASCENCHRSIYKSHTQTAHYLTSRPAQEKFIKGSFTSGRNKYVFPNNEAVLMEHKNSQFFQTVYKNGEPERSYPFDIVIGSGRKGQTYLYWQENDLYQLPISYYTPSDIWVNSPGYTSEKVSFDRIVPMRCLECHSTVFKTRYLPEQPYALDKEKIIYGIDCERCHGPAADHVLFHQKNPEEKKGQHIINSAKLSRQQKLEACALCHSGMGESIKPSFSFLPGDTLAHFFYPSSKNIDTKNLDVHGNQYGLLTASKCFQRSKTMDCSSCHNTHIKERDNLHLFSQRCMNCHKESAENFCKMAPVLGKSIKQNCIDCHMPATPSKALTLQVSGDKNLIPDTVRTHLIGIYTKSNSNIPR